MAFWPGLESVSSYLISYDKRWHITSFRILLTTILLAFQLHIPSFTHLFPENLPIPALRLCAQVRPSQILNTPPRPRPHHQQLVLFSGTLPPYLSLTSFNLHSLALDFTDPAYLSLPEMSCPFLGSALPIPLWPHPFCGQAPAFLHGSAWSS